MNINIKIGILFVVLMAAFSSCDEVLDLKPAQSLATSDALGDYKGVQAALVGAYDRMQTVNYYGRDFMVFPEVRGDNVYIGISNSNRFISDYNYQLSASTTQTALWNRVYSVILYANNVINNVEKVKDATQAQKDQLAGEALAIRALGHFDLVRVFAKPYSDGGGGQLGVPIKLDGAITDAPRNKVSEVYDQIIKDLIAAKGKLNQNVGPYNFTVDAVNALLSRVYLYKGDNVNAEISATDVIGTNSYSLENDLNTLWSTSGTSEEIFTLQVLAVETNGSDNLGQIYNPGSGYGDIRATSDIRDMYSIGDKRIAAGYYLYSTGEYYINKFLGESSTPGLVSPKILRLAEVYLNRAEARAKQSNFAGALSDIDVIRARAGVASIGVVPNAQVLDAVLDERRRELAFEGHRSFDLYRNGKDLARIQCNTGLEVNVAGLCFIDKASNLRVYPIPQRELDANKAMVQNDGY